MQKIQKNFHAYSMNLENRFVSINENFQVFYRQQTVLIYKNFYIIQYLYQNGLSKTSLTFRFPSTSEKWCPQKRRVKTFERQVQTLAGRELIENNGPCK